jgi:hypothetical protein
VLALVVSVGVRFGPTVWRQTRILYWQRQCMNYTASPAMIVYEEEAAAAAKLMAADSQYANYYAYGADPQIAAAFKPRCWANLGSLVPNSWKIFGASFGGATIFLHERTSPAGHRRLVSVRLQPNWNQIEGFHHSPIATIPATLTKMPAGEITSENIAEIRRENWHRLPQLRVYAGQIDPADSSHFSIHYEMWGQGDILDGRLGDDDRVTLKPRNPPKAP